jgi:hypothetical protein
MARPIPLDDKIAYLEAAVEAARLMQHSLRPAIARGSFNAVNDHEKLGRHIDAMLDALGRHYLERAATTGAPDSPAGLGSGGD